ncbi:MAG: hypothetical protein LBH07_02695 [Treponema sp.]|jgi:hypothetical protein|nr:hypothetical protein [Treponema sp.]
MIKLFVVYVKRETEMNIGFPTNSGALARDSVDIEGGYTMAMVRYMGGRELTPEEHEAARLRIEAAAKRPYTPDPDCPLIKTEPIKISDLSPEQIERITAAKKRRAEKDPHYENMTLEDFINWHPVNFASMEERARHMQEAGIVDPEKTPTLAASGN